VIALLNHFTGLLTCVDKLKILAELLADHLFEIVSAGNAASCTLDIDLVGDTVGSLDGCQQRKA
jgi:hypothetical protein